MKRNKGNEAQIQDIRDFAGGAVGHMRPWESVDGNNYALVYNGRGDRADQKNYSKQLVTNATLRYDEWRTLDDAVVMAGTQRLVGFTDLKDNGLVYTLNNPLGTTVLTYERLSEAMEAVVSIDPVKRSGGDTVNFETAHLPIPVVHSDFSISDRVLQESRNRGDALSTMNAAAAARRVAEKLEDMLFGATSLLTYGGGTIYTYQTEPNNVDISLSVLKNSEGDVIGAIGVFRHGNPPSVSNIKNRT